MKKAEELSQRDLAKLEGVKKMIACSAAYRKNLIISIIKNILYLGITDDDEQKAALLLEKKKFCTPECISNYRILCQIIIKKSQVFDPDLSRKARSFAKANKLELNLSTYA